MTLKKMNSKSGMTVAELLVGASLTVLVVAGFAYIFQKGQIETSGALDRLQSTTEKNSLFGFLQRKLFPNDTKTVFTSIHDGELGSLAPFPLFLNNTDRGISAPSGEHLNSPNDIALVFPEIKPAKISTVCTTTPDQYQNANKENPDVFLSKDSFEKFKGNHPNGRILIIQFSKSTFGYSSPATLTGDVIAVESGKVSFGGNAIKVTNIAGEVGKSGEELKGYEPGLIHIENHSLYLYDQGVAYGVNPIWSEVGEGAYIIPLSLRRYETDGIVPHGKEAEYNYADLPQHCFDRLASAKDNSGRDVTELAAILVEPLMFKSLSRSGSWVESEFSSNFLDDTDLQGATLGQLKFYSLGFGYNDKGDKRFGLGVCENKNLNSREFLDLSLHCVQNQSLFELPEVTSVNFMMKYSVSLGSQISIFRYILTSSTFPGIDSKPAACLGASDCDDLVVSLPGDPVIPRLYNVGETAGILGSQKLSLVKNNYLISFGFIVEYANGITEVFKVYGN
jgi:hypothetical protein